MSEYVMDYSGWAEGIPIDEYLKVRDAMHARKREEIVRCRDCKHYTEDEMEYYHFCGSWCEQVEPDGFCAWGERRDA